MAEHDPKRATKSLLPALLLQKFRCPSVISRHDDDSEDWKIRSRYFHSLGMDHELAQHDHIGCARINDPAEVGTKGGHLSVYTAALKGDCGQTDDRLILATDEAISQTIGSTPTIEDNEACGSSRRKIVFCPLVQVHEIPGVTMYSKRIRGTIWMTPQESAECIRRNTIEYMAEGYEPEGVLDESEFIERNGKLVHPVCLLLDEPENILLKQIYSGTKPKVKSKGRKGLQRRNMQKLTYSRMHAI